MKKVIIFGLGPVGIEYTKIFQSLGYSVMAVGRSAEGCDAFHKQTSIEPLSWLTTDIDTLELPDTAVVAVGEAQLTTVAELIVRRGCKKILVEKPGASSYADIQHLSQLAEQYGASVSVAYNRRFYASVIRGKQIIEEDGGVRAFHFDFSEWSQKIEPLTKEAGVKERWFIHNSSHVVDLAFYLGGWPTDIDAIADKPMDWHPAGLFVGSGSTHTGALFSFNADWVGPGRWGLELTTAKHRLIYKPLEKLHVQELGSIAIHEVDLDDSLDDDYKPGFYKQVEAFLSDDSALPSIGEQAQHLDVYRKICPKQ